MRTSGGPQSQEQPPLNVEGTSPRISLQTTFRSFRHRNYTIFWIALLAQSWAMNMQIFARAWFTYDLTDKASLIGVVALAEGLPILAFSLYGGALADRLNKRNVLIGGYCLSAMATVAIAAVISTGSIEWWHLVFSAFALGASMALTSGARQSIIPELVDRDEVLNAISLGSTAGNATRIAAPAIAGLMIVLVGVEGVYYMMSALHVASVFIMLSLPSGSVRSGSRRQPVLRDIADGLRYVRDNRIVLWLLVVFMATATLGMPYLYLMPVIAQEAWGQEPDGIGFLYAGAGVGALFGSLALASLGNFKRRGLLLLLLGIAYGTGTIAMAVSPNYLMAIFVVAAIGVVQSARMSLNSALIQIQSAEEVRGRVMGVYIMIVGLFPLGILAVGGLVDVLGPRGAFTLSGGLVAAFSIYFILANPSLRRLQ